MTGVNPLRRAAAKIREINSRYKVPRIKLSRTARLSLLVLRVYLIVLVILLAYRFVTLLRV